MIAYHLKMALTRHIILSLDFLQKRDPTFGIYLYLSFNTGEILLNNFFCKELTFSFIC